MAGEGMPGERVQVFAVVRIDKSISEPIEQITVQSVLPNLEEARSEAVRLNSLVDPVRKQYFVRATRFYPQGRSGRDRGTA